MCSQFAKPVATDTHTKKAQRTPTPIRVKMARSGATYMTVATNNTAPNARERSRQG